MDFVLVEILHEFGVGKGSDGTQAQGGKQALHGVSPFVVGSAFSILGAYLKVASQALTSSSTRLTARLVAWAAPAASKVVNGTFCSNVWRPSNLRCFRSTSSARSSSRTCPGSRVAS